MKDYGMTKSLKHINKEILAEINQKLNIRYSTYDVIKTILKLSEESDKNKGFYLELKRKYLF